ncbi:uncharacterized protein LOC108232011 isoform X2 [Kryptolebias marmoratus]|nr:uncharacterized protein LOC108232011 isoform X2 [Kryptolebias marmoratus]XP_017264961.1 uncharacterized protein LOC108232011 isoform X2 [Kryptolebias marmoratus]
MPLPSVGTQRIIQGNGTNVGTVISLQCPAKHKLVGNQLKCVMGTNSTQWVGRTYCQSLSSNDEYGFRVAVLASIISSGIIMLMSVAFITCCLLDCVKEDTKRKPGRGSDALRCEEQQEVSQSHYNHKSRNNNNNNSSSSSQETMLPLWDTANPALCDDLRPYRCQQQYTHSSSPCAYDAPPSQAALPGHNYDRPVLHRNLDSYPPEYPGPPLPSRLAPSSGHVPAARSGLLWQHGGQRSSSSGPNPPAADESNVRNLNSNRNPREISIRIISV